MPIPEPWATELQDYRVSLGEEAAAQVPTHITLVPPLMRFMQQLLVLGAPLRAGMAADDDGPPAPFGFSLATWHADCSW